VQQAPNTPGSRNGFGHNPAQSPDICRQESVLLSIIQAAGWPIWPLIACSIITVALIIERFMSLRRIRVAPAKLLDEVMSVTRSSLPSNDVVSRLAESSLLGRVLAAGMRTVIGDARTTETSLRNAFEIAGRDAMHQMERYLNALATIVTAAPLMGLLGTVVGMIEIFASQSSGSAGLANPAQLAQGISIALYNTAFGLIIAIPALLFFRYFRGLVNDYRMTMELAAERMVPQLLRHTVGRGAGSST
jgi:biopolymer transport protein ExbB